MNRFFIRIASLAVILLPLSLGTQGKGVVHAAPSPGFTTLTSFTGTYQSFPSSSLVQGRDGNFYGTTEQGGSMNDGTVFKITPAGKLTTLVSFTGDNGADLFDALVAGSDGNFYGTTAYGGSNDSGTVFKVTPSGTLTTLVNFNGTDGAHPVAALVLGNDGNLYGTTEFGVLSVGGTAFKVTPAGVLTTLAYFTGTNGDQPYGGLIQGEDGNFYGTTASGGLLGYGIVYRLTPDGTLTTLHTFDGTDGTAPLAPLVQGRDGNFYGTTIQGGAFPQDGNGNGTVFKITPSGTFTTLVNFDGLNGYEPYARLIEGSDGNFYGTTSGGGSTYASELFGLGTVFETTPSGALTTLVNFDGFNGAYPISGLVSGADGNLYGTASEGGNNNDGTVFRLSFPLALPPTLTAFTPGEGPAGSVVILTGINLDSVTAVRFHEASAKIFAASADGTRLMVTVPKGATKGTITVSVTSADDSATTATPFRVTYAPVITSFFPASGPVGSVTTITGTKLNGITRVRFHNADAAIYASNADGTKLTVTVPLGAATGTITLDNRDSLATTSLGVYAVTH